MQLQLQELESRLWSAANALRGPVDPADFKTYVFPMLFWKWISDSWDYEHAQAVNDYGDDVDDEVEADYHRFSLPDGTHWGQVTTSTANLGSKIATALARIEQANPQSLAGIFGDAAWGNKERLPESSLVALINAFNGLALNPEHVEHDVLGQAYEYLLKNFADESGKKAGEFFTPRQVVRLIVRMLDPQPGESIYDPAAGSGGMLVETINSVRAHGGDTRTLRLYGQEVNLTTAAIARMNLFLHEIEDFKIVRGDTLRSPGLRKPDGTISQFDVVIANPPFSLSDWGAELWAADARSFCGVPPAKNGDFAWVQHMVSSMTASTGRVGVVMPHGVLFRGGAEARIRQCLIEQDRLEAVVGLPGNLFYSTNIPAAILVFRAAKHADTRGHVMFLDASQEFVKDRAQSVLLDAQIDRIVASYNGVAATGTELGVPSRRVPLEEMAQKGYSLDVQQYLRKEVVDGLGLNGLLKHWDHTRHARARQEAHFRERLDELGVASPHDAEDVLAGLRKELLTQGDVTTAGRAFSILMGRQRSPERAHGPSMTRYLRAANVKDGYLDLGDVKEMDFSAPEREQFALVAGDVLVTEGSGSPQAVGAAARWNDDLEWPVCIQNTLLRFRAVQGVSTPNFTYQWCRWAYRSGAFRDAASGTNILHIGSGRAAKMRVLLPSLEQQDAVAELLALSEGLTNSLYAEAASTSKLSSRLLGTFFDPQPEAV